MRDSEEGGFPRVGLKLERRREAKYFFLTVSLFPTTYHVWGGERLEKK